MWTSGKYRGMCGSPRKGEDALMVLHLNTCLYGDIGFSGVRMKL